MAVKNPQPRMIRPATMVKLLVTSIPLNTLAKTTVIRTAADEQLHEKGSAEESHTDIRCNLDLDLLKSREKHQQDGTCQR